MCKPSMGSWKTKSTLRDSGIINKTIVVKWENQCGTHTKAASTQVDEMVNNGWNVEKCSSGISWSFSRDQMIRSIKAGISQ